MKHFTIFSMSLAVLAACSTGETINERSKRLLVSEAQQVCSSYGYRKGTARYNECVGNQKHNIKTERELRKQRNKRNSDEWDTIFSRK